MSLMYIMKFDLNRYLTILLLIFFSILIVNTLIKTMNREGMENKDENTEYVVAKKEKKVKKMTN